jgi:hypothetical protein
MTRHLRDEETFQTDGHLTEAALTALTDGEDELLTVRALSHVGTCEACAERMGELALLSVEVNDALGANPGLLPATQPVRRALPMGAVLVALALAVIGAVPSLLVAPGWLAELPGALVRTAPITLRATGAVFRALSAEAPLVTIAWMTATTVLVTLGVLVARLAPRRAHQLGGAR